jgi:hypothetical protein
VIVETTARPRCLFWETSLRHMDQREPYWTLAECVAWVRTRDHEAVKGCVDPGLSLKIPDEILQILEDLRQRCREGSLQACGRRWDPSPDALPRSLRSLERKRESAVRTSSFA